MKIDKICTKCYEECKCKFCPLNKVEDEQHFVNQLYISQWSLIPTFKWKQYVHWMWNDYESCN